MIPVKTVQDILDAARIEEVVGDFVALRKRGVNLIGLCPFHGEKSPSFNVNPPRNVFKCFGCGKAGDAVTFLREHESLSFEEALRWLARKYNIEIQEVERTPEQRAEQQLTESLFIVNEFAEQHFSSQMFDTDEGKSVALAYFKQRGLREDTLRKFGLGYAPDQRDLLLLHAKQAGHSIDLLKQTGLCSSDGTRDFFRARVMFAIHNLSGKIAAFAGRTLSKEKTVPKYVNSPETAIYVKNKTLYGLFQAKTAIRKADECILVEGYMDVISLAQAGIENVVASSGTSLTEGQLQLIKRNTPNLTILYDGDAAGIKAALRGLDLALEQDLNVRMVLLPDGHDPDSYVQELGKEALEAYMLANRKDFILFKTSVLLAETKGDPIKKAELIKDIVGSISKIPDPIKRSVYLRECAGLLQVDETALIGETNKNITQTIKKNAEKAAKAGGAASDSVPPRGDDFWPSEEPNQVPVFNAPPPTPSNRGKVAVQERDIVRLLVQFGHQTLPEGLSVAQFILTDLEDSLESFEDPTYSAIVKECYELVAKGQVPDTDYFVRHDQEAVRTLTIDFITSPWEYSPNWEDKIGLPLQNQPKPELNFEEDMRYAVDLFKLRQLRKMAENVNPARIQQASREGDMELLNYYLSVQMKIKEALAQMAKKRNIVVLPK